MTSGIEIKPGRWYYGLFLLDVPKGAGFPFGGDIMGCLWREDDEPEKWHLDYRFRYNAGENTDPWDMSPTGDRKSWWHLSFKGNELSAIIATKKAVITMSELAGAFFKTAEPEYDWLTVRGDCDRFIEAAQRAKKSWMHMKTENLPPVRGRSHG